MATTITIDPVTRLEGHLKINVEVDQDTVNDAWATGTLFRGFETILVNRPPEDAQHITQRICGVCPVPHGLAAVMALDSAYRVTPPANARIMRNLVLGANFIQSHILHFYHLSLPDFVDGPDMPPWQPSWGEDKRFSDSENSSLVQHYVTALEMTRKAHEMGALFGGRMPHPPTYVAGGFTTTPRADRITKFKRYLESDLLPFIRNIYLKDADQLAKKYPDYFQIGRGCGNLLSFGVFDLDAAGNTRLLKRGRAVNGSRAVQSVDINQITEQVAYSWYADRTNNLRPASGATEPQYPKGQAYSWSKAPRYGGVPYEAGPLARMWVNGDYTNGISVMDRHMARARETLKIAEAMLSWVGQLNAQGPVYTRPSVPSSAISYGLTEAPRGALGHWLNISGGRISRYMVITPTCWNASPRDSSGTPGPIEQALVNTPVDDADEPVEVLRVIHSFDPCLSCAVHVMRPAKGAKVFILNHSHGEDAGHTHDLGHSHGSAHDQHLDNDDGQS
ncbi:MAG: nickel-dependent hydrogenase large subunit [Deltaproteobacteria bacterium]